MKARLAIAVGMSVGCATVISGQTSIDDVPPGVWSQVDAVPSSRVSDLPRTVVSAPGRTDGADGTISGFCPPRAEVFAIADGRSLVIRDPCSGTLSLAVHDSSGEHPVSGAAAYGAGSDRRAIPLADGLLLIVIKRDATSLLLVDLNAMTVDWVKHPKELSQGRRLEVAVSNGRLFLWGGIIKVAVGSGGCEHPPPGMGCDPYVVTEDRPNVRIMSMRPQPVSHESPEHAW